MGLLGGAHTVGFLLVYELLTSNLDTRILPTDDPFELGSLLARMMPPEDALNRWVRVGGALDPTTRP